MLGKANHSDMEDKSEKDIPKWAFLPAKYLAPSAEEVETNVHEEVRGGSSSTYFLTFLPFLRTRMLRIG